MGSAPIATIEWFREVFQTFITLLYFDQVWMCLLKACCFLHYQVEEMPGDFPTITSAIHALLGANRLDELEFCVQNFVTFINHILAIVLS